MKNVWLLLLTLCAGNIFAETSLKLSEALQKKLISINVAGAASDTSIRVPLSSHIGPCMAMDISSLSADALNLTLEYGYRLVPDDSTVQTMMVSQTLIVKLAPKQKKTYRVYAFCTEASDGGPGPQKKFNLGKRSTGNLLALAELINRKKYQTEAAQSAVWCLTNDHDLASIESDDTTMMYDLRRFVAKVKNLPLASIYTPVSTTPATVYHTRVVYSGTISYSFSNSSKVMIALFDEDNHMKKVYVNETQRPGEYSYNYEIGSDEMNNKKHYLRMFRDGKLDEEISILPRD